MHAQSNAGTGAITGRVLDVSGKPITDASVSVMNESSGAPSNVVADLEGHPGNCFVHSFLVLLPLFRSIEVPMSHNTTQFTFTGVFN
jgi:hypothetical protein